LIGAGKWVDPPAQDGTGLAQDFGTPQLTDLGIGEVLRISMRTESLTTATFGESLTGCGIGSVQNNPALNH